jgi:hypothetical protein
MKHSLKVPAVIVAAFMLAYAMQVQATYVDCYPYQQNLASGWTDSSTKTDDTVRWSNSNPKQRGWVVFDLRELPMTPWSYDAVELHYNQVTSTNSPTVHFHWAKGANPFSQAAAALFDSLDTGFQLGSEGGGTGPHEVTLPPWDDWPNEEYPNQSLIISFVGPEGSPPPLYVGAAWGWRSGTSGGPFLRFITE